MAVAFRLRPFNFNIMEYEISLAVGWLLPAIAGAGVVGNAISSLFTNRTNKKSVEDTNQTQIDVNQANNEFNAQEAEKARQFNSNEAALQRYWEESESNKARQFNSEEAEKARQFNSSEAALQRSFESYEAQKAREWDSPAAQMERLRSAGINPAMVDMGISSSNSPAANGVAASSGSAASASNPSGASATGVAASSASLGSLSAPVMQSPQFGDITQGILNLAQAKKIQGETDFEKETFNLRVREMAARTGLSEFELKEMSPARLDNIKQQFNVMNAEIKKFESDTNVSDSLAKLYDNDGQLKQKELDTFADKWKMEIEKHNRYLQISDAQIKESISRMSESYAKARLAVEQGKLTEQQAIGQSIQNGLSGLEFDVKFENHDLEKKLGKDYIQYKVDFYNNEIKLIPERSVTEQNVLEHDRKLAAYMSSENSIATEGLATCLKGFTSAATSIATTAIRKLP